MMLLTIILMMSMAIQDTYSSEHFQYYLKDEPPEEASLRVLRRTDPGSPSPMLPVHFSMGAGPQRSTWWLSPEKPYTKRRQRVAYYNLNSFGLRYGKREQNTLAGFKQKIHANSDPGPHLVHLDSTQPRCEPTLLSGIGGKVHNLHYKQVY